MIKYLFLSFLLFVIAMTAKAEQKFNDLEVKNLDISSTLDVVGKIEVTSTTQSSKPCPPMSEAQRDAISSPATGSCVYNATSLSWSVYNGSSWQEAGSGGLSQWLTATVYSEDDVVIESDKIYICQTAHTSGTFATDLAAVKWSLVGATVDLSTDATGVAPIARGGTNKSLTLSAGGVPYFDADSFEVLSAGTSGRPLLSGGASAPTFGQLDISTSAITGTLGVANGGTGATTLTANNVILGNGTSAVQFVAPGSSGNMLVSNGTTWASSAVSGSTIVTSPGVTSPKTCRYGFGGGSATLASPTECTTGTCVEVIDTCGASPPSRDAAGYYSNTTWPAGTWANSVSVFCSCTAFDSTNSGRLCVPLTDSTDNTWSTKSDGGMVLTVNSATVATPAGNDTWVQIECTGAGP